MFGDMIADLGSNIKISAVVTEFFLRGTKLDISLKVPQTIRLHSLS